MVSKSVNKRKCNEYIGLLLKIGEDGLLHSVIGMGMKQSAICENPEDSILDESEALLKLYRQTGKNELLIISKIFRKSAHIIYRQLLIQNSNKKNNKRFLHLVA